MNKTGVIYGINGPVVYLKGNTGFKMSEMVYVGKERLVGEVIALTKDTTTVQVFEETTGLKPGETVTASGDALSVTLGPGILNNIFDGIERPLSEIAKQSGKYISRGLTVDSLDTEKKWDVHVTVSEGEELMGGAIIAETQETRSIVHKSMVPPDVNGTVIWAAKDGKYTILDPIVKLKLEDGTEKEITLAQKWPIRVPRPTLKRYPASVPLITGQRILDTMFPIAKGGTAAIPGGFGTGKTMTQHQIAKWSDADIIIYIGCGERGNEMTDVLNEFPELKDPKTGQPLMQRTVLIANTSDMPVVSNASCTTNCLAPICKVLEDNYGIEYGLMSTIHAATAKQKVVDSRSQKDWRTGRSAFGNLIPSTTGAAKAISLVIPALKDKMSGISYRVPTSDVSIVDLNVALKKPASYDEICKKVREASETYLSGILDYVEDEVVSSDFIGDSHASIFDARQGIQVNSHFFKVICFYDNEWGYTSQIFRLIEHMDRIDHNR